MPHQCVNCNKFYEDGSSEILKGCSCGGKLFFYVKKNHLKEAEEINSGLKEEDKKQMEKDIFDLIGQKQDPEKPVILDFESIKVLQPGKYQVDLVKLFKKDPIVFKVSDGKYIIDLHTTFEQYRK